MMPRAHCSGIGVSRDQRHDDRMVAVLRLVDDRGQHWVVDLSVDDLRVLLADLRALIVADQATVDKWWQKLADGRDGRPKAAVRT
jgi:hypothetical protein